MRMEEDDGLGVFMPSYE